MSKKRLNIVKICEALGPCLAAGSPNLEEAAAIDLRTCCLRLNLSFGDDHIESHRESKDTAASGGFRGCCGLDDPHPPKERPGKNTS